LVIYNVFFSANKHIVVVKNNNELHTKNDSLCGINEQLQTENNKLKDENKLLSNLNDSLSSEIGNILPKVITSIKKEINESYNWTTPELALDLLKEKLKRIPSKDEYRQTLKELESENLLYHSGYPDPSSKGKKIEINELDKIIANK
jgi:signal recognition particle GTPase